CLMCWSRFYLRSLHLRSLRLIGLFFHLLSLTDSRLDLFCRSDASCTEQSIAGLGQRTAYRRGLGVLYGVGGIGTTTTNTERACSSSCSRSRLAAWPSSAEAMLAVPNSP